MSPYPSVDILTFSAIYPNNTYIFQVSAHFTRIFGAEPQKIIIVINQPSQAPDMHMWRSSYRFLTCDGLLQRESSGPKFVNLVSAYRMEAWLVLLSFAFISAIVLKLIFNFGYIEGILLPYAFLLEQGVSMPPSSGKLFSAICTLTPWLLMGIVLSNGYKGNNVTDLIAPLAGRLISTFQDLLNYNYTVYVPVIEYYDHKRDIFFEEDSGADSRLHHSFYLYTTHLKESEISYCHKKILAMIKHLLLKIFLIRRKHKITLLDGVLSCNKSAIVVYGNEIDEYEAQLKFLRPKSHIVKSKDELFQEELGWMVYFGLDTKLEERFKSLFQAGMTNYWRKYVRSLRMQEFNMLNRVGIKTWESDNGLMMGGNFVVVFYLYGICILICAFAHGVEQVCRIFSGRSKLCGKLCILNFKYADVHNLC